MSSTKQIRIIVYHYVRDAKHSRFPGIKGIGIGDFRKQIEYVNRSFNIINIEQLIETIKSGQNALPPNAALLSFDDGYIDQYMNVFPILNEMNIQGSFFPAVKPVLEAVLLDVNKIQFIIACVDNKRRIVEDIFKLLDEYRNEYSILDNEYYYDKFAKKWRLDSKEVIFVKRMLQSELPGALRLRIIDKLFKRYVTEDERGLARELYMSIDQIKCMRRNGMYIGGHGYSHYWMNNIDIEEKESEIDLTLRFLKNVGSNTEKWVMSYPYGAYDGELIDILKRRGCMIGFAMKIGVADIDVDDLMKLPRMRTNDFPGGE